MERRARAFWTITTVQRGCGMAEEGIVVREIVSCKVSGEVGKTIFCADAVVVTMVMIAVAS